MQFALFLFFMVALLCPSDVLAMRSVNLVGLSQSSVGIQYTTITDAGNDVAVSTSGPVLTNYPDATISYFINSGQTLWMWVTGSANATYLETTSDNLAFTNFYGGNSAYLGPSGGTTNPDSDYVGLSYTLISGSNAIVLGHCENHHINGPSWWSVCAYNQTGVPPSATSFSSAVAVLTSSASPPTTTNGGLGIPSCLVPPTGSPNFGDGFIYCEFLDIGQNISGPTEKIGIARCSVATNCSLGSNWTKWSSSSWSQPGLTGTSDNILPHFDPSFGACCQTFSWNTAINAYVHVYFTGNQSTTGGWYICTSQSLTSPCASSGPTQLFPLSDSGGTGSFTPMVFLMTPGSPMGTTGSCMNVYYSYYGTGGSPSSPIPHRRKAVACDSHGNCASSSC